MNATKEKLFARNRTKVVGFPPSRGLLTGGSFALLINIAFQLVEKSALNYGQSQFIAIFVCVLSYIFGRSKFYDGLCN